MKTRITLILLALFISSNFSFAQQDEECMVNFTIMTDYTKNKKYDEAYEPWMKVRNKCAKFNRLLYMKNKGQGGQDILLHKIENSTGAEKVGFINDLLEVYGLYNQYFSSKFKTGKMYGEKGNLSYKYKSELGLSNKQVYDIFDAGFKQDLQNFTSTKALYTYFKLMVDMHKAGETSLQDVFNKYDDINEQLENINQKSAVKLNKLIAKEEAGETLSKKDAKYKKFYQQTLDANNKIAGSLDTYLGQLADCENLIPLYQKDFDTYKTDAVWLKRAVSRMYNKECTDDPLYIELVKAYDATAPSADTKYFTATILYKQGKNKEGDEYIKQAYELEDDQFKKGRLAKKIANGYKKRGSYGAARKYYREALKLNPSDGTPHLQIAAMYAKSANNCGDSNFNKRAVFWYAAQEALKAGKVDPSLKKSAKQAADSYNANAPTKSEIFTEGNAGTTITIGCWINGSVKVPNL